uniref:Uncharacterized protein n=1 Tax=Candidatus Kentrum sp. TUN TaxID=2126343 RepID=A0A450ZR89_9GAMM|nr:MAG: hypothetical protein BECKTUN1418F_GA0071002_10854 [Candidatus Kentron sp. TUN]VFK62597.1 MAG: hypothetical protein BECKTUN1418E_GA0071001_10834 [Candidatus Kentron sp. TUN]
MELIDGIREAIGNDNPIREFKLNDATTQDVPEFSIQGNKFLIRFGKEIPRDADEISFEINLPDYHPVAVKFNRSQLKEFDFSPIANDQFRPRLSLNIRVINPNGDPVPDHTIIAECQNDRNYKTDPSGKIHIELPRGVYQCTLHAMETDLYNPLSTSLSSSLIHKSHDFKLEWNFKDVLAYVKLFNPENQPIAGATIKLHTSFGKKEKQLAEFGDTGVYSGILPVLTEDSISITVASPGMKFSEQKRSYRPKEMSNLVVRLKPMMVEIPLTVKTHILEKGEKKPFRQRLRGSVTAMNAEGRSVMTRLKWDTKKKALTGNVVTQERFRSRVRLEIRDTRGRYEFAGKVTDNEMDVILNFKRFCWSISIPTIN